MSALILVRHAAPEIVEDVPSEEWRLSEKGHDGAARLWPFLADYEPKAVFSGPEPKIAETANILARAGGIPARQSAGLAEHARRSAAFTDRARFEASIESLFREPDRLAFGDESASETLNRFARAIDSALQEVGRNSIIAVSGGTAISLFVAQRCGVDGFALWRTLKLPHALVINCSTWQLTRIHHGGAENTE
jgi:broad specificity phosphatase PhoE